MPYDEVFTTCGMIAHFEVVSLCLDMRYPLQ